LELVRIRGKNRLSHGETKLFRRIFLTGGGGKRRNDVSQEKTAEAWLWPGPSEKEQDCGKTVRPA